jgi:hypothetical protein
VEFFKSEKKVPEFWWSQDFGTFSDLQNSTFKYPKMPSEVSLFFRVVAARISVRAPRWQKGRHFLRPVRVLTSGIFQIWKKCQNPGLLRILELFRIYEIPLLSTLTGHVKWRSFFHPKLCKAVWAPRQQNWRPFSWTLEVLTSGIFQIWKKFQNPEDLRFLVLFSDFQNSTFKYL